MTEVESAFVVVYWKSRGSYMRYVVGEFLDP